MHPLAQKLNETIKKDSLPVYEMLSEMGRRLYFPKGILAQSAEAKAKASRFNATIGIATRSGHAMFLPSVMRHFQDMPVDESTGPIDMGEAVVVQDQPEELSSEQFDASFSKWTKAIEAGKRTADEIITAISEKNNVVFTQPQKDKLHEIKTQETNADSQQ